MKMVQLGKAIHEQVLSVIDALRRDAHFWDKFPINLIPINQADEAKLQPVMP